jgi:hypothetical protein
MACDVGKLYSYQKHRKQCGCGVVCNFGDTAECIVNISCYCHLIYLLLLMLLHTMLLISSDGE